MISNGPSITLLADFINGFAFKSEHFEDEGLPVVRIKQLLDSTAEVDRTTLDVSEVGIDNGDVIFSWSASLAVKVWDRGPALLNQHLFRVDPKPGVHSRWLAYALMVATKRLEALMHGSAMTHITRDMLKLVTVDLPSEHEQRAIADYLDAETARIDALIEKKRRLVGLLKSRFKLEIDHAIEDLSTSEAALGRFVLDLSQGSSPQAAGHPAEKDEWGVLKLSAVKSGRYNPQENKALLGEPYSQMVPRAGDLLVTRSNTPGYVGDVAAVTHIQPRRLLPDLIYRLRLDSSRISAEFAAYSLLASRSRHRISSLARGSSQSMVKLRGEDIRSLPVPAVTTDVQDEVVKLLNCRRQQTSEIVGKLNHQIELLTEHRQVLITAAVTGQLEAPKTGKPAKRLC